MAHKATRGELVELARILEATWPVRLAALKASGVPLAADETAATTTTADTAADGKTTTAATDTGSDPGAAAGKTFTQDELNTILAREKGQIQARFADYDDLKAAKARLEEIEESQKTEAQRAADRITQTEAEKTTAQQEAAEAKAKLLRFEVAAEKGLPSKWATRLSGSTKEDLEADADTLLKELGASTTSFDGGPRGDRKDAPGDMDALIRRAAGRT